jgi:hypothetical protein
LHPWNKAELAMEHDPFDVLLNSVCQYFVEMFASIFIKDIGL